MLVVPSLINRAYILDLAPGQSLLRYLAAQGLRPLLLDWGAPGEEERGFDVGDYITRRLEPAAEIARQAAGAAPVVLGYCMGGLLALALATRRPELVTALALLATPWRFHAERAEQARLLGVLAEPIAKAMPRSAKCRSTCCKRCLPPWIRCWCCANSRASPRWRRTAPRRWASSRSRIGSMTACRWRSRWRANVWAAGMARIGRAVGNGASRARPVRPRAIEIPTLIVVPAQDRIVPPATAAALAEELPLAETWTPRLGHIGMIVARDAPSTVWEPLGAWLAREAG